MTTTRVFTAPALLALAIFAGYAGAQTTPATPMPGTGSSVTGGQAAPAAQPGAGTRNAESRKDDRLARGDRKFVEKAAAAGMFEVQVAQLAATKASDPNVKSFASMLVDHHTGANNELVQLSNMKGIELPVGPPRGMRKDIERLGKKSGSAFDKAFLKDVGLKAHEKDIKLFEKASKDLNDAQLKAFVDKTLPVLRQHLQAAQTLRAGGTIDAHGAAAMGNAGGHAPAPAASK